MASSKSDVSEYLIKLEYWHASKQGCSVQGPDEARVLYAESDTRGCRTTQVFTGDKQTSLLSIPFNPGIPGYEIVDVKAQNVLGVLIKYVSKWLLVFHRAEWVLMDARDREIASVTQRNIPAIVGGFPTNTGSIQLPQKYEGYAEGRLLWTFRQSLNLQKLRISFTTDLEGRLSTRLALAVAVILAFESLRRIDFKAFFETLKDYHYNRWRWWW